MEGRTDEQAQELQKRLVDVEEKLKRAEKRAEEAKERAKDGAEVQEQLEISQAQVGELTKLVKKFKGESSVLTVCTSHFPHTSAIV